MDVFRFTVVILREGSNPDGNLLKIIGPMFQDIAELKFPLEIKDLNVCIDFL